MICPATCPKCGATCTGVDDHEPPFHGCISCGTLWHVAGYEHVPIPERFDYSQFDK
jgi:hypothetical protein